MELSAYINLVKEIKGLPYGRNSDRSDYTLVQKEKKGTCSTKHAYLKWMAVKEGVEGVELKLCFFKMNSANTKAIGKILEKYRLDFIPEAHCYLNINGQAWDVTHPNSNFRNISRDIEYEEEIEPDQIGDYKVGFHKNFLKKWIRMEDIPYSFKEVWKIREECIAALSA